MSGRTVVMTSPPTPTTAPNERDLRRWRRYLAEERAEAATYRAIGARRSGEEREILLGLAEAEGRHEQHWVELLGDRVGRPARIRLSSRVLIFLAERLGSVFVLALAQRAEGRSPYATDQHATEAMAADEMIHAEVIRGLAVRGRNRLAGTFRAAVFGANDGLVSNLALVLGIAASGASSATILLTGVAGLLAGALSMGAGEYVSVRSQRELLEASTPSAAAGAAVPALDVNANELALVYRARGMTSEQARDRAADVLAGAALSEARHDGIDEHEAVGTGLSAGLSSFCFFASGAIIAILPFLFGMSGYPAMIVSAALVGLALLGTGAIVGLLSGAPPLRRALRQLAIGYGAAAVTFVLGLIFGASGA